MNDTDLIKESDENWLETSEYERNNRSEGADDLAFYAGDQWDSAALNERKTEGRPALVINLLTQYVRQVIGDQRQNRLGIRVRPANSAAGVDKAQLFQGMIRHIEQISNADQAYDQGFMCSLINGFGYWRVDTDYLEDGLFEQEIYINRIADPFTVYFDPRYEKYDSCDKNYAFVTMRMSKKEFDLRFPGAAYSGFNNESSDSASSSSVSGIDDITLAEYWFRTKVDKFLYLLSDGSKQLLDKKMRDEDIKALIGSGIQILALKKVEAWKVQQCLRSSTEILGGVNDWAGIYIPIVPCWGEELMIDGKRHLKSLIRDAKDPQRMYNYFRTNITERIGLSPKTPYLVAAEQIEDHMAMWETANRRVPPYLAYKPITGVDKPSRIMPPSISPGEFEEANSAKSDITGTMGINEAMLGKPSNERSGTAISMRKAQSANSTYHHRDAMGKALQFTGRILVDLIPRIYDTAREVRIIGDEGDARFESVNAMSVDKDGNAFMQNDLNSGKVEVFVDVGVDYPSQRVEASEMMIQLMQAVPQIAPQIVDLVVKNLDWAGAKEISQRLQAVQAQQQQAMAENQKKQDVKMAHGMAMEEATVAAKSRPMDAN